MCLDTLDTKPPKRTGYGWKVVVRVSRGGYMPSIFFEDLDLRYRVGEWNKAKSVECGGEPVRYQSGFHIWLNRADAERNAREFGGVLVRVQYRKAPISGTGEGSIGWSYMFTGAQVVADDMRIVRVYKVREEKYAR